MIEATAAQCAQGYSLEVIGHAEYACGNDVVCAAVSALVESLAAYLEEYDELDAETDLAIAKYHNDNNDSNEGRMFLFKADLTAFFLSTNLNLVI